MRLYRVHLYSAVEGSMGYEWVTNKRAAELRAAEFVKDQEGRAPEPEVETVEFPLTKRGVLFLLRVYAAHEQNG